MQARGEHNPRDIDKHIFQVSIPRYDAKDAAHVRLVALAEHAERIVAGIDLPMTRFELQRAYVRKALEDDGVSAGIDAIVKAILEMPI